MKTLCCLSFLTLFCLSAAIAGNTYGRTPSDVKLVEQSSGSDGSPAGVWMVPDFPVTGGRILEAELDLEVSVSRPTVFVLEADEGRARTVFSSVLVHPGDTRAVLDATGLVRAHTAGRIDRIYLVRKPVELPGGGGDRAVAGEPDRPDAVVGAKLVTIPAPERRSRVRDSLRERRDPDIAQSSSSPGLPDKFGVKAFPNPFNPVTTIQVALPVAADVDVTVYNVKGQRVKTLHSGKMKPGYNDLKWRGRDNRGNPVASGIYFYRVKGGANLHTGKLMLLK